MFYYQWTSPWDCSSISTYFLKLLVKYVFVLTKFNVRILNIVLEEEKENGNDIHIGDLNVYTNITDSEFEYENEDTRPPKHPQNGMLVLESKSKQSFITQSLSNVPEKRVTNIENNSNNKKMTVFWSRMRYI